MRHILPGLIIATVGGLLCGSDSPSAPDPDRIYTQEEALRIGWPNITGPAGTFISLKTSTPLVGDLSQAKVLWESECTDLGGGKGGSAAFRTQNQFTAEALKKKIAPGSWSGPIVAEGLVICASWRPCGEWKPVKGVAAEESRKKQGKAGNDEDEADDKTTPAQDSPANDQGMVKVRLDAEDTVTAIDALTGKTRWQVAEPGGMLRGGGKRKGIQVSPVAYKGVVYSQGSTSRLFAHEISSGKKRWDSEVHPSRGRQMKARAEALASVDKGIWPKYEIMPGSYASLMVAQDTLIVPDQVGGLLGVDLATGARIWSVNKVISFLTTPSVWRHDGREYLLCGTESGELRLLDPTNGKELWVMKGLGPNPFMLTAGKDHVLVNVLPESGVQKGVRTPGRLGAVRLSLSAGEKAWTLGPKDGRDVSLWMDNVLRTRILYREGLFLVNGSHTEGPAFIVEERTGKVLSSFPSDKRDEALAGLVYWCGDQVLSRGDSFHGPTHGGRHPWSYWTTINNTIALAPGKMDLGEFANGYEYPMDVPLVGGLMFERCLNGGITCYDLRKR